MIVNFEEYKNKQKELDEYKDSILKLIDEYVEFNNDFKERHNILNYIRATDFYFSQKDDRRFKIQFLFGNDPDLTAGLLQYNSEVSIMHSEYKDLQQFMEDPELYKATKKYNV